MKEVLIQRAILDYLTMKGFLAWRNQAIPVPIRRGRNIVGLRRADPFTKGMPDIFCLINGRFYGLEVKNEKGRLSEDQIKWKERIEKAGGAFLLVRSVDDLWKLEESIQEV